MFKIYLLTYQNTPIYIGQTTLSLPRRLSGEHYNIPYDKKDLSIHLLEETDDVSRERYYIELYRSMGSNLLNKRNGNTGYTDPLDRKKYDRIRKRNYYHDKKFQKDNARHDRVS